MFDQRKPMYQEKGNVRNSVSDRFVRVEWYQRDVSLDNSKDAWLNFNYAISGQRANRSPLRSPGEDAASEKM